MRPKFYYLQCDSAGHPKGSRFTLVRVTPSGWEMQAEEGATGGQRSHWTDTSLFSARPPRAPRKRYYPPSRRPVS